MWQKIKNIQIPGDITAACLVGAVGITMGLFTVLPITPQSSRTSEGNTSGKNEPEIVLRLESGEELRLKATGRTTMEVLTNLRQSKRYGRESFTRVILSPTNSWTCEPEETRHLFINNVLTEILTMDLRRTIIAIFSEGTTGKIILATTSIIAASERCSNRFIFDSCCWSSSTGVQPIPVIEYKPKWVCPDCTPEEQYVLTELQEHTRITDRNALAAIMGNIQQESRFIPNICEGGNLEFLTGIVIAGVMVLFSGPA